MCIRDRALDVSTFSQGDSNYSHRDDSNRTGFPSETTSPRTQRSGLLETGLETTSDEGEEGARDHAHVQARGRANPSGDTQGQMATGEVAEADAGGGVQGSGMVRSAMAARAPVLEGSGSEDSDAALKIPDVNNESEADKLRNWKIRRQRHSNGRVEGLDELVNTLQGMLLGKTPAACDDPSESSEVPTRQAEREAPAFQEGQEGAAPAGEAARAECSAVPDALVQVPLMACLLALQGLAPEMDPESSGQAASVELESEAITDQVDTEEAAEVTGQMQDHPPADVEGSEAGLECALESDKQSNEQMAAMEASLAAVEADRMHQSDVIAALQRELEGRAQELVRSRAALEAARAEQSTEEDELELPVMGTMLMSANELFEDPTSPKRPHQESPEGSPEAESVSQQATPEPASVSPKPSMSWRRRAAASVSARRSPSPIATKMSELLSARPLRDSVRSSRHEDSKEDLLALSRRDDDRARKYAKRALPIAILLQERAHLGL
eukprot:TRINITY_DN7392_c0_g1_i4.p1 TRINITY_DN7392_c0_g1~~TRINITY_DN7392_c0_g1_i4.p1  ORF type:complete len:499 (-),score=108.14 TRINITY_DN7392_c0_g1_i4:138-1634(-)